MHGNITYSEEELKTEIWKSIPIPEYKEFYQVSNLGRIRSLDRLIYKGNSKTGRLYKPYIVKGKLLIPLDNRNGYKFVCLANKSRKLIYVHRLVAMTFLDNPDKKPFVNHKDENTYNNRVSNLEWVTPSENRIWGTLPLRKNRLVSATDSSGNIRNFISIKEAAKMFGISTSAVFKSCNSDKKIHNDIKFDYINKTTKPIFQQDERNANNLNR